jgi:hypothetical protein
MFLWTCIHEDSFQALKHALVMAPVLALPNFYKPFQLQMDASDLGVSAVLLQEGHPLPFISKASALALGASQRMKKSSWP